MVSEVATQNADLDRVLTSSNLMRVTLALLRSDAATPDAVGAALRSLPSDLDVAREQGMRRRDDMLRFLAGRALVLSWAGEFVDPAKVAIECEKGKKPRLRGSDFDWNLSHDHALIGLVTHASQVGIDICCAKSILQDGEDAREVLRPAYSSAFDELEWSYIYDSASEPELLARFAQLWVVKESFVKAMGAGLAVEPRRVHVELKGRPEVTFDGAPLLDWSFHLFSPMDGYWVCVCGHAPELAYSLEWRDWTQLALCLPPRRPLVKST